MNFKDDEFNESELTVLGSIGYTIGKEIGKGSFAKIHLADYKKPDEGGEYTLLACRIIDQDRASLSKEHIENFLTKELDILHNIKHPNLIQVQGILEIERKIFIFMRFEENGDLLQHLKTVGPLTEVRAKKWFRQMASGLEYLHEKEIAHRDLKCENFLISKNWNVKIGDFGFATYCVDEQGRKVMSTTYCGSVCYAAPEVISNTPHELKPADVWSMGVVLYSMLTAQMPFDDSKSFPSFLKLQVTQDWKFRLKDEDLKLTEGAIHLLSQVLVADILSRLPVQEILAHSWLIPALKAANVPPRPPSPVPFRKSIFTNTQHI